MDTVRSLMLLSQNSVQGESSVTDGQRPRDRTPRGHHTLARQLHTALVSFPRNLRLPQAKCPLFRSQ